MTCNAIIPDESHNSLSIIIRWIYNNTIYISINIKTYIQSHKNNLTIVTNRLIQSHHNQIVHNLYQSSFPANYEPTLPTVPSNNPVLSKISNFSTRCSSPRTKFQIIIHRTEFSIRKYHPYRSELVLIDRSSERSKKAKLRTHGRIDVRKVCWRVLTFLVDPMEGGSAAINFPFPRADFALYPKKELSDKAILLVYEPFIIGLARYRGLYFRDTQSKRACNTTEACVGRARAPRNYWSTSGVIAVIAPPETDRSSNYSKAFSIPTPL